MFKISQQVLHEIAFRINAQRSSGFDQAFGGARSAVAAMQSELQRLNQTQNNISGYQRQQQQVQRTTQRLENYRQQYNLIQREIAETTGSTTKLERESLRLQERIDSTSRSLENGRERLRRTGEALRAAGVDTENLAAETNRLTTESRNLQEAQERAAAGARNFGSQAVSAFDAAGQALAAAGIYSALDKVADRYQRCINLAGEFESGMSDVAAISNADQQALNVLADKAKYLGANSKYTASESAAAMGYMAMAGWDENDMLNGMDGVLQLAAASGEDIAMVSDIVTDSLSAFHMTAADTSRFADVLAATATNANTNVAIMGETFKNSASIAGALGYKIEDVAMAVGLMANNGIKGSIAGTALKNTFNGLLEGVTLTGAAFGEYEYSAVKIDGTMKSFGDTINELRGYFEQMTEAERVANARNIAGAYGYNGLLGILLSADADYNKLTESINNCEGAAERMAAIRLDNLQGDITLAQSAAEALQISLGEQFLPITRKVYQEGGKLLTLLDEYVQVNPAGIKAGTAFIGTLGGLTTGITGVSAAVRIFQAMNVAAIFSGPVGVLLGLATAAAAVAGGIVAVHEGAFDSIPPLRELTSAARDMEKAMQDANVIFAQTESQTLAAADVAEHYIDKLEQLGDGENLEGEAKQEYLNTLTLLCRAMPELSDIVDTQTGKIEGGTEALRENTEAWKENALAQARQRHLESYQDALVTAEFETAENSIKLTEARDKRQTYEEQAAKIQAELDKMFGAAETKANEHNVLYRGSDISSDFVSAEDILAAEMPEYAQRQKELAEIERQAKAAAREEARYSAAVNEGQASIAEATVKLDNMEAALKQLGETEAEQVAAVADSLDQSAAAADSAKSTMQAYIDGIYSMLPQVRSAFSGFSNLLPKNGFLFNSALNMVVSGSIPSAVGDMPENVVPQVGAVKNAYASGTESAARGWALVGEQGPELLFMQGGEQILTSQETEQFFNAQRLLESSAYYGIGAESVMAMPQIDAYAEPVPVPTQVKALPAPAQSLSYVAVANGGDTERIQITVAPVYNISGNAAPEELQEILRQHDENLTERIKEALTDLWIDHGRRAFA